MTHVHINRSVKWGLKFGGSVFVAYWLLFPLLMFCLPAPWPGLSIFILPSVILAILTGMLGWWFGGVLTDISNARDRISRL